MISTTATAIYDLLSSRMSFAGFWLLKLGASPHSSREFVTKPPRRHARRARGAAREGGILETVC